MKQFTLFAIINVIVGGKMRNIIFIIIVSISFFATLNVDADTTYIKGKMTDTNVALRRTSNNDLDRIKYDENSTVTLSDPETFEIIGETGNYFKINVQYKGIYYTGYIPTKYSKKVATYTVKSQTVNEILALGFNETYAYKLAVLKTIYPKWTFIPYETNLDFNDVVDKQANPVNKNLINSSNKSLYSTEDGSLKADGTFQKYDNGSWYAASRQTIGYYLDPRNFFNEGHIFMFETLQYNKSAHDKARPAVQEVLRATFMDPKTSFYKKAFACKDGYQICVDDINKQINKDYLDIFSDAGNIHDVNPVHLSTRVYQEQGLKGSSSIISGNGYNGKHIGYFNHFNVAASGNGAGTIISGALSSAENRGWNSPYASIVGGAEFIRKWYIGVGQDTVYFQKFDVVDPASYSHQYMQNVTAPYSEGYFSYTAYERGDVMNEAYTFKIPIYKNMPAYTTLGIEGSDDANLSSLNVTGCSLMPTFSSSAVSYTCNVTNDISSVKISATSTSKSATIKGTGTVNIPSSENNFEIIVTSAVGNSKSYNLKIIKVNKEELTPDDIISKLQINNNSGVLSGFNIGTNAAELVNNIKSLFPSSSVTIDSNKKIATETKLTVKNKGTKTYTLLIYGDNNGDGLVDILDLLTVQKHILGSKKLTNNYYKASDTNKDGTVDILDLLTIQKHILGTGKIFQ
ncbi:MAG: dockerin type I domain-containing protein [Bacilli bacterium]|nr:dockerin type I domain-containing protein [Bacilli bacterium]